MTVLRLSAVSLLAALLLTVATPSEATPIVAAVGLAGADATITFDEVVLAQGAAVTNQYAALGVTFESLLYYDTLFPTNFPGISGHRLGNFLFDGTVSGLQDPFSIRFTSPVEAATFGLASNIAQTRLTAFYQGVGIESFLYNYPGPATGGAVAFVGFQGLLFDEIRVDIAVANIAESIGLIDNVQYRLSEVPEPGSMLLLGAGLAGLWAVRRRRA